MTTMRWLFAIVLLQGIVAQTSVQSIEGVVVERVTSAAIVGADLELTGIAGNRIVSYTTETDSQGRFVYRNVAVSDGYWLIATHRDLHMQTVFGQRGLRGTGAQISV